MSAEITALSERPRTARRVAKKSAELRAVKKLLGPPPYLMANADQVRVLHSHWTDLPFAEDGWYE